MDVQLQDWQQVYLWAQLAAPALPVWPVLPAASVQPWMRQAASVKEWAVLRS